ncbi:hypothetical protein [Methylobacterium sp. J-070]|uniref:hypothetical protein n=1 Tax=Methylobacterium sp. J-070 TaxID=2836650 RepID=UPI001FBBD210|nr:hypothetical protein [Methylobacterium sp. J-070]MCJ2051261.1 hypothetical protein [Methylobacterium sp. J-070]
MSADLKEAFHLAVAKYLFWNKLNKEQMYIGWLDAETGQRHYLDEPAVPFFGKDRSLSEICGYAEALTGKLPDHIAYLFNALVDDGTGSPEISTYAEAVEALRESIDLELERPQDNPLSEPCLIEKVRADALQQGADACLQAMNERMGGAT